MSVTSQSPAQRACVQHMQQCVDACPPKALADCHGGVCSSYAVLRPPKLHRSSSLSAGEAHTLLAAFLCLTNPHARRRPVASTEQRLRKRSLALQNKESEAFEKIYGVHHGIPFTQVNGPDEGRDPYPPTARAHAHPCPTHTAHRTAPAPTRTRARAHAHLCMRASQCHCHAPWVCAPFTNALPSSAVPLLPGLFSDTRSECGHVAGHPLQQRNFLIG